MRNIHQCLLLVLILSCWTSYALAVSLNDTGKINETVVSRVLDVESESDIVDAIKTAEHAHLPISIMAVHHSQGGQTLAQGGVVLNMLPFDQVLAFDPAKKQITIESGMTWDALQHYINPYNLSVKVMQDSYIFSVGGSLSADAHGEDFRAGPIDQSVIAFHLILANGRKVLVTPVIHPELWKAVLGGYGSLGVISDVTLQLTDNDLLQGHYEETDINHVVSLFEARILPDPDVIFFYGRLDIAPGKNFLRQMYVITSSDTHQLPEPSALNDPEAMDFVIRPIFNWSRHSNWGKWFRWSLEKQIIKEKYGRGEATRNEIMRKAILFAVNHQQKNHADWLQEYFIPMDQLPNFVGRLRDIATANKINLLNATVRYIPEDDNILLSYAKTDCFSVVLYFDQDLSAPEIQKSQSWTKQLIDAALAEGGSYYLTYQDFATRQQFEQAYAHYEEFRRVKHEYDPGNRFTNKFYQAYLK